MLLIVSGISFLCLFVNLILAPVPPFPTYLFHCNCLTIVSVTVLSVFFHVKLPRVGPGYPLSAFAPLLSIPFLFFCSLLLFLFSFSHSLYLFSSIVHPIPFYQNRPTPFPGERS